jgi:hypothetical protein
VPGPTAPDPLLVLTTSYPSDATPVGAHRVLQIVGAHGYRLNADQMALWAEVDGDPGEVCLALWAQPVDAEDAAARILVAEWRTLLQPVGDGTPVQIDGEVFASVPSGASDWRMVMTLSAVLADGRRCGKDERVFARPQGFLQPVLVCGADLSAQAAEAGLALASVGIRNPRAEDNLSGSLRLELWALAAPYAGGAFAGECLGGVEVGPLAGQAACGGLTGFWAAPSDAEAELVLMLREWTPFGWLTRDHRAVNRAPLVPVAPEVPAVAASAPTPSKPKARNAHLLNVNLATEEQLVAIDGLNRPLAKAVIAARPFASIDDLLRIHGVGEKRLARMRRHLCV